MHRFMLWQGPNAEADDGDLEDLQDLNARPPIVHVLVRDEANDGRRRSSKTIFTAPNMEMSENDPRQVLQNLRRNMQMAAEQNRLRQLQVAEDQQQRRVAFFYTGVGLIALILIMLYILDPMIVLGDIQNLVIYVLQMLFDVESFPFVFS